MKLTAEYTFHGSHWNEEFFEVNKVHAMPGLELICNQHGHLWLVSIEVTGDAPNGIVCDYNALQAIVKSLDFTFLPMHPLTNEYLCDQLGVTLEQLRSMPEWGTAGKLEVVLRAITWKIVSMIARPGLERLRVTLHETGPAARRNVTGIFAEEVVTFGCFGESFWSK